MFLPSNVRIDKINVRITWIAKRPTKKSINCPGERLRVWFKKKYWQRDLKSLLHAKTWTRKRGFQIYLTRKRNQVNVSTFSANFIEGTVQVFSLKSKSSSFQIFGSRVEILKLNLNLQITSNQNFKINSCLAFPNEIFPKCSDLLATFSSYFRRQKAICRIAKMFWFFVIECLQRKSIHVFWCNARLIIPIWCSCTNEANKSFIFSLEMRSEHFKPKKSLALTQEIINYN